MKARLYGIAAVLALAALLGQPVAAQNIPAPQGNYTTAPAKFQTYYAAYTAITTAASLTDFFTITGSATKTIYITHVACSGVSTASGTSALALVKRSTADSGGTALTPSATVGGQLVPLDVNNVAATATVVAYSANPTTGTAVGIVRSGKLNTSVAATANGASPLVFDFSTINNQALVLRGTGAVAAMSGLGTALVAGAVLSCEVSWIEQ